MSKVWLRAATMNTQIINMLAAAGARLRDTENIRSVLPFRVEKVAKLDERYGGLVLTNHRVIHVATHSRRSTANWAAFQDIRRAGISTRKRDQAYLLLGVLAPAVIIAVGIGLFDGIATVVDVTVAILAAPIFLALWWFSGGDVVIEVDLGGNLVEGKIPVSAQSKAAEFLEEVFALKNG